VSQLWRDTAGVFPLWQRACFLLAVDAMRRRRWRLLSWLGWRREELELISPTGEPQGVKTVWLLAVRNGEGLLIEVLSSNGRRTWYELSRSDLSEATP
jgi:hypothetical protein